MPQRKVGKRKRLKPLMLSGVRGLLRVVVHLESVFVHLHMLVTRASYFRRRCARRRVPLKTTRYVLTPTPTPTQTPTPTPTADANETGIGPEGNGRGGDSRHRPHVCRGGGRG